ncbi:hypothetical protein LGH70_19940 [Hymenobacter sp. BT635]|uniref:Uncharacterized protein n=1 Tax=Hymenobacter nitidus TaxID=2880929 RepID=A0ABS8AHG4_9BACT|nr:hypothetical protein [Hymenobacter nitidus]MCB2379878.1 hypothetical protein [Hymenobacter nitidus]
MEKFNSVGMEATGTQKSNAPINMTICVNLLDKVKLNWAVATLPGTFAQIKTLYFFAIGKG